MNLITSRNTPSFAKDTVYRFMKMIHINWIRFTTILSSRIIQEAVLPLDSKERANVLILDDSMFECNRSKKVELLAKVYDHARHRYHFGFRMLTLGWSDGSTFLPVNSILLSSEKKKNRVNEAATLDKRTAGYKRRALSMHGITYKALPFGPVPENWGTLYSSLPGIDMEEYVYPSGQSGIKLEATENTDNKLNESELCTIEKVCALFSNMSAGEISQTSHLEKGWMENKDNRSAISYQDAFALNYD